MLPYMNDRSIMRPSVQTGFGGLNHNLSAGDGEIYDMRNLSSREYPLLVPRPVRGTAGATTGVYAESDHGRIWFTEVVPDNPPFVPGESQTVQVVSGGTDILTLIELAADTSFTIQFEDAGKLVVSLVSTPGEAKAYRYTASLFRKNNSQYPVCAIQSFCDTVEEAFHGHLFVEYVECIAFYSLGTATQGSTVYHWTATDGRHSDTFYADVFGTQQPNGAGAHDKAWWAADEGFYYDRAYKGAVANSQKQYAVMGTKIIIFPDKKYYDFDADEFGSLEASQTESNVTIKGSTYADVDAEANTIYKEDAAWATHGFKAGDAVTISGCAENANNGTFIIREIDGDELRFYENTFTVNYWIRECYGGLSSGYYSFTVGGKTHTFNCPNVPPGKLQWSGSPFGCTYVYQDGEQSMGVVLSFVITQQESEMLALTAEKVETGPITISRSVPDLDYICVNENRLWGCKGDSIYASKLGDPTNFNVFDGLSTDSWAAEVTDAGDFTACISYMGYPTFFKEDAIYKIQGDIPGNFAWSASAKFGVKSGSARSLAIAGETLYYLSRVGVVAYTGGFPSVISAPLGVNRIFDEGVAGTDGIRYYITLREGSSWEMYAYDTRYGCWHKEDEIQANSFYRLGSQLFMVEANGLIWDLSGKSGFAEAAQLPWEAEFADMTRFYETTDSNSQNKKGLLRLQLRCKLASGSSITVYVRYDGGGWHEVGEITSTKKQSYNLPLILRRCDYFQLKLEGSGDAVVYSLTEVRYSGSNLQGGSVSLPTDTD